MNPRPTDFLHLVTSFDSCLQSLHQAEPPGHRIFCMVVFKNPYKLLCSNCLKLLSVASFNSLAKMLRLLVFGDVLQRFINYFRCPLSPPRCLNESKKVHKDSMEVENVSKFLKGIKVWHKVRKNCICTKRTCIKIPEITGGGDYRRWFHRDM